MLTQFFTVGHAGILPWNRLRFFLDDGYIFLRRCHCFACQWLWIINRFEFVVWYLTGFIIFWKTWSTLYNKYFWIIKVYWWTWIQLWLEYHWVSSSIASVGFSSSICLLCNIWLRLLCYCLCRTFRSHLRRCVNIRIWYFLWVIHKFLFRTLCWNLNIGQICFLIGF